MQKKLLDPQYMAFPFQMDVKGVITSTRSDHIREQIRQVLLTNPGERVFRLEFGVGVRRLVFEPNNTALWELTRQRLFASLSDVLRGEVDPASLEIERLSKENTDETLHIRVAYRLATINRREEHVFQFPGGSYG